ncbi:MAG: hypothetical protein HRU09_16205 [Oligoflexales bacterium]|nr:hypothetical protein [Oligoflexales bacterium]
MTNFPNLEKVLILFILSHFYACDLKLPDSEEDEMDEAALEERLGREIPSDYENKDKKYFPSKPAADSCIGEISSIKSAYGQFVFTIDHELVDPCHLKGYVVGLMEELQVKRSNQGFYFIDYLPEGKLDIVLEIKSELSFKYEKGLALRLNGMVVVGGIRVSKEGMEIPEVGQLTGQAFLTDSEDHAGIRVYVPGTHYETVTLADGSYRIEPFVPVGTHNLFFEKSDYHHGQIEAINISSSATIPTFDITLEHDQGEDGFLFLANKDGEYPSRTVPISVGGGKEARLMKISEDSLFQNASWQPVVSSSFFTFDSEGPKTLYLKFLQDDGHESQTYEASVTVIASQEQDGSIEEGAWTQLSSENAPSSRSSHAAVWTGSHAFIWGGDAGGESDSWGDGFLFDPFSHSGAGKWQTIASDQAPSPRFDAGALWTGSEVFVWGGASYQSGEYALEDSGARYDPSSDSWASLATENQPSARAGHLTVLGEDRVYIWGGFDGINEEERQVLGNGAIYDLLNDSWIPMPESGAPSAREKMQGVWIGDKLMIWGGFDGSSSLMDGAIFDPAEGSWVALSSVNAPSARHDHNMIWTGEKVLVWGGQSSDGDLALATGGLYDPLTDSWTAVSMDNAPSARFLASGTWTGEKFMVWGGQSDSLSPSLNDGGIYSPATDSWQPLPAYEPLLGRSNHGAVWTGSSVLVWGGEGLGSMFSDGAQFGFSESDDAEAP